MVSSPTLPPLSLPLTIKASAPAAIASGASFTATTSTDTEMPAAFSRAIDSASNFPPVIMTLESPVLCGVK